MEVIQEYKDVGDINDVFEDKIMLATNSKREIMCYELASGTVTSATYLNKATKLSDMETIICNNPAIISGTLYKIINQSVVLLIKWYNDTNIYFDITLNRIKDGTLIFSTNKLKINSRYTNNTVIDKCEIRKLHATNSYLINITYHPNFIIQDVTCFIFSIEDQKIKIDTFPNFQVCHTTPDSDSILLYNQKEKIIKFYNIVTGQDKIFNREYCNVRLFGSIMKIEAKNANENCDIIIVNHKTNTNVLKLKFNVVYDKNIVLSASDSFYEYECVINSFSNPDNCIKSMSQLYEIIRDAISSFDDYLEFRYEKNNNNIVVTINLLYKYMKTQLNYKLTQKNNEPLLILERKVDYLCANTLFK